jgi:hypothetical protein
MIDPADRAGGPRRTEPTDPADSAGGAAPTGGRQLRAIAGLITVTRPSASR